MTRPNQFLSPEGDIEDYFVDEYWLIDQWVGDTLMTWGRNNSTAQLGDNTVVNRCTPVTTFAGGTNWKQVAAGSNSSAAIKIDGTLWLWGPNSSGNLGSNDTNIRCTPVTTFAGGTNWKQVSIDGPATAAVKTDGTLWVWGYNISSQLGINATGQRNTPVTTFAGGTDWKQVTVGGGHVLAIKTDGTLWVWGSNYNSQLGINITTSVARTTPVTTFAGGTNWKQVSAGNSMVAAIKTDGTLWTWGHNINGALGVNDTSNRPTPVTTFAGGTNWKQVSAGYRHVGAVKTDGTLWVWGRNAYYGALGVNNTTNRLTPVTTFAGGTNWKQVACGNFHTAAIKTDGSLWTIGNGGYGQLGNNTTAFSIQTPITTFAGGTNWKQVASGHHQVLAVTSGTDPTFFIA